MVEENEETPERELYPKATQVHVMPPRFDLGGWNCDIFFGEEFGGIRLSESQLDSLNAQIIKAAEKKQNAQKRIQERFADMPTH